MTVNNERVQSCFCNGRKRISKWPLHALCRAFVDHFHNKIFFKRGVNHLSAETVQILDPLPVSSQTWLFEMLIAFRLRGFFFFLNPFSSDRYQLLPCLLVEAFRQLARDWIDSMCLVFWRKPTFVSERDNNRSASEVAGANNRKSDKRGLMCLLAAGCGSMTTPIGCVIAGQHVN